MRVCSVHGCPAIYPTTEGTKCERHRKEADVKHWDNTRGYNTTGHRKTFRPGVLARDRICVLCHSAPATVADHYPASRRDLVEQGLNPDLPEYGRGLCASCHGKATALHQPGGWNNRT